MAWEFKVIFNDRRASGGLGEQDLTARFDAKNSHLVGTAGDKIAQSQVVLRLKAGDAFHIDSFTEFWAGYRDSETQEWDNSRALYAGFITDHTGTFRYKRHIFECEISNYNILFDRCELQTWPPLDPTDPPEGFETGKSIRDWLIGTVADDGLAYDGVIPAHYLNWNNGGVAPVFDSIILTDNLPAQGMSEVYGYFGFMTVRALNDEIMKVAKFQARIDSLDIKPSYFWRPIGIGTEIIKQFCCIDLNDQSGTPAATYALDPTGDQLKIGFPYRHRRNANPVRTRVTVKGEPSETEGLVYFSYLKTAGEAAYPSAYHLKRPGWAGAPINESRINTNVQAEDYATQLGDDLWGPEGTITLLSRKLRQAGDLIRVIMPPDGIDEIFPLIEHDTALIPTLDTLTLGHRPRGIEDILIPRPDAPLPVTDAGTGGGGGLNASAAGIGYLGANVANVPRQRSLVDRPVHSDQNVTTPRQVGVVGQTWQAAAYVPPALMEDPPAAVPLTRHKDTAGNDREWTAGTDGTGHPHHYVSGVTGPGDLVVPIPDDSVSLVRESIRNLDGTVNTDVVTTYVLNGGSVAAPSTGTPIVCVRDDVVVVTFSGPFPTGGIAYTLSEAPAL